MGVLASGRGSNFEALVRATRKQALNAEVRVLVANVADAPALQRAAELEVPSAVVDHRDFAKRADFEHALITELNRHDVRLVCLAGFMRILSPVFVQHYQHRIMNIHPSLLPAFAGLIGIQVHQAVIAAGVKLTGCTVHFVTEDVDAGPIIVQRAIPVHDDDTPESLALRVLVEEHQAYPEAVRLFALERLRIDGHRVQIVEQ